MTCLGGFYRNLCRLKVSYFANHDDIWVLTQKGTQRSGKVETNAKINLCLVDAGNINLNWIFSGRDITLICVEDIKPSIK